MCHRPRGNRPRNYFAKDFFFFFSFVVREPSTSVKHNNITCFGNANRTPRVRSHRKQMGTLKSRAFHLAIHNVCMYVWERHLVKGLLHILSRCKRPFSCRLKVQSVQKWFFGAPFGWNGAVFDWSIYQKNPLTYMDTLKINK
jgi:hypothetical protein